MVGISGLLAQVFVAFLTASSNAATPPTLPMSAAPPAARARSFPVCSGLGDHGLPLRAAFEKERVEFQSEIIAASFENGIAETFLKHESLTVVRKYGVMGREAVGQHEGAALLIGNPKQTWWAASYGWGDQAWKGDLLAFVDKNRALLGFGPGERAVRIGNRIYKSYANGARSAGYVATIEEPRPRPPPKHPLVLSGIGSVALVVRSPGCGQLSGGFRNTLPPFDADLAAPPGIDGHEGLQVFHDLNPYLEVEPVDGAKGPRYATRLVATVTRTLEARLAWDVRYSYSCWNVDYAKRPPILERHMDHAYIDARSGALVYGRKPRWSSTFALPLDACSPELPTEEE